MKKLCGIIIFAAILFTAGLAKAGIQDERALFAYLKVRPGTENQFKKAAEDVIAESRRERGMLIYNLHQSLTDPQQFIFYELFRSHEDLVYHRESRHVKMFLKKVEPILIPGKFILREFNSGEF